ncbi:MAG: Fic family protein [Planctomycetota bacterium]
MDPTRFTAARTGKLIEIHTPVNDWAFIPEPLSPSLGADEELDGLLVEAMTELGRLDGAGIHFSNPELLLRPLRRREALKSSSLEGTHATAEQLVQFELPGLRKVGPEGAVKEVINYARALDHGAQLLEALPYCLRLIKEIHERLLRGVRGKDKRPGIFRETQVHIGSDRRFVPTPPEELESVLDQFEKALHGRPKSIHPLIWCYLVHYQFETIHPFNDGNGRVGRLLLALMVSRDCDLNQPWLYMSPWFEKHSKEYIDLLFEISATGAWEPWIKFCLRGTIEQAKDALQRLKSIIELKQDYLTRVSASDGVARLVKLVDELFAQAPAITIPHAQGILEVSYPTARSDVNRLIELGIVEKTETGHPKLFVAWDILRIGSAESD